MMLTCHCGAVRLDLREAPAYINACNCSLCSKTGAWWAYFDPAAVTTVGSTSTYSRSDKPDPAADVHFCAACGSTTHFSLSASAQERFGNTMMGVNMQLAEPSDLAGLELRYPDGRAWQGEGEFTYVREASILGDAEAA